VLVGGRAFALDETAWKDVGADGRAIKADDAIDAAKRLVDASPRRSR
jgi:methanogenic corrinoid protein MtbC1